MSRLLKRLKKHYLLTTVFILLLFLAWRLIRPLNIFIVDDRFAWPIDTTNPPEILDTLNARQCGSCHEAFYKEWQTTIHSQAWNDPYFQADWQFDGSQPNCRLCHTPLDRQQPQKVLAYRDAEKWDPVLATNPDFDSGLQHEGVTCAACHYRNGRILGVLGNMNAPHAIRKIDNPNQICVRCHIVKGERWDTFFRFPPCGTVAEIRRTQQRLANTTVSDPDDNHHRDNNDPNRPQDYSTLGCVECHMPLVERPLVAGGEVRLTRHHYWRGGHDPEMVKQALSIDFSETGKSGNGKRLFRLMITNIGAEHYVPTGTPDRHLTVDIQLLDADNRVLDEQSHRIKRTVMWRPFIMDLWDTRLPRWLPRHYEYHVAPDSRAVAIEAVVKYHLLDTSRQKRIGYDNKKPISYEVFRKRISLATDSRLKNNRKTRE